MEGNRLNSDDVTLEDFAKVLSYDVAGSNRNALKSEMVNKYNTYKIKYAELERRKKKRRARRLGIPRVKRSKRQSIS
ncbi:hypothetical protein NXW84_09190 [Bacteroides fragilis]|nr:hypothetical protein NXW84_09190 [Bacteroides fragilis]